jgi:hypothetical protein
MKTPVHKLVLLLTLTVGVLNSHAQNPSSLFSNYKTARQNGSEPFLPDFSYAGYQHGETAIPDVSYKIFDVTDTLYGAIPGDNNSDKKAIEKAIAAAEAHGSGIIFFPPGKFLINEPTDTINQPIVINSSNIVLRGSGSGEDETELIMNRHMDPTDTNSFFSCPYMFTFKNTSGGSKLTTITQNATRESYSITVADASGIMPGQWVKLHLQNTNSQAVEEALAPVVLDSSWTDIVNKGVAVREIHQVESVSDNTITFKEPIHKTINSSHKWEVWSYKYIDHVGIEDIAFIGNCPVSFDHHGSALDDSGWSCIQFIRTINSWVRRCRFSNWSQTVSISESANCSAIHNIIDGNDGHTAIKANNSTHILIGLSEDQAGQWHSFGFAGNSTGNVLWRVSWPGTTCYESHASQPYSNLIDKVEGGLINGRWGGAVKSLPNHLSNLVFWNFNNTASVINGFEFWESGSIYGRTLPPIISGFHGNPTTFVADQVQENESWGQPVDEESLYEEQLKYRLGQLPDWLVKAKANAGWPVNGSHLSQLLVDGNHLSQFDPFTTQYSMVLPDSSPIPEVSAEISEEGVAVNTIQATDIPGKSTIIVTNNYGDTTIYTINFDVTATKTETFTNYTVDGWQQTSFTGYNGINWQIAGRRETYLDDGNCVYFYENVTGIKSQILSGGIDAFSIQAKDLWSSGTERRIELLVNGQVVAQTTHTGTETYTFTAQDLNIKGDFNLGIRNASDTNVAVAFDNISWTSYAPDYNAHLSGINVNGVSLPDFNRDQSNYQVEVTHGEVSIEGTPESSKATVELMEPQSGYPGTATINVMAEDGSTKSYYVTITYPDTDLQSIQVDQYYINGFETNKNDYTIVLKEGTTQVPTISPTTSDSDATFTVDAATQLPGTSTITVTAANGVTQKVYQVHFEVANFTETFSNLTASSYASGSYTGDNNLTVTYSDVRLATSTYQIENQTAGIRANSFVKLNADIGVGSLTLNMRRFWFGSNSDIRQLEVFINDSSAGVCQPIGGSNDKYIFTVKGVNMAGPVSIEVKHTGGAASANDAAIAIDNISWTQPTLKNSLLTVNQDTYIEGGTNKLKNYGTNTNLVIKGITGEGNYDRQSFMLFDLNQLDAQYIQSAMLHFKAKASTAIDYSFFEVINDNWQETTLTWDNQPATGNLIGTTTINSVELTWYEYNLTDYIRQEYNGDKKASLKILDEQLLNIWSAIQSKETVNDPYLEIEYVDATSFEPQGPPLKSAKGEMPFENQVNKELTVSPNPFNNDQSLTLILPELPKQSDLRIIIYNLNGRVVKQYPPIALPQNESKITITDPELNPGIYLIITETDNNRHQCKLIVQ